MQEQLDRIESKLDFLISLLIEEEEEIELPEGYSLEDDVFDLKEPATL